MSASLYIYYRIDGNFLSFEQSARKIMAQIESELQIKGRLLQRRDDPHTWMEIYEPLADDAACHQLQQSLAEAVASEPCWQNLSRHAECFFDLPSSNRDK
ncbi:MAG: DUF4936 family protein [Vogesella sp.]|nr:DUF4936 family protein [Vogesella sp.]